MSVFHIECRYILLFVYTQYSECPSSLSHALNNYDLSYWLNFDCASLLSHALSSHDLSYWLIFGSLEFSDY